jgi:hypothetical protein
MENTMDLTVALPGEICDDLAMLFALESEDSSLDTEPFTITFADPDDN